MLLRRATLPRGRDEDRRYPEFADMRAALAAMLADEGYADLAEEEWTRVEDARCRALLSQWNVHHL